MIGLISLASADSFTDKLEQDTDRMGMDYRRIELTVSDPLLCQSACMAESGCQSFTYVKPGLHAANAVCYLKNGTPNPAPNSCCISGLRASVTPETENSTLFREYQNFLRRPSIRRSVTGQHDTLKEYTEKCNAATGIQIPSFNCDDGVEPHGQGNGTTCDKPNVLNGVCDPGSRFQVLPGRINDAVAVAHCRKQNNGSGFYGDIAIIQHNKANGATCFYQALGHLPGAQIPSPLTEPARWQDGTNHWINPEGTERIGCTACHDNGAFIRSPYLAQLTTPPHALPSTSEGYSNLSAPLKYVGLDYASNRSWSITTANAPGDSGTLCTACHRLAVNNHEHDGNGTALRFANVATASAQRSKNPHSVSSPIWMRPGQIFYDANAEASASRIRDCARRFRDSGFTSATDCTATPLATAWEVSPPPHDKPVACTVFDDGAANESTLSEAIYFADAQTACIPDGTSRGLCRRWFGNCISTTDQVKVAFKVFNDGAANPTPLSRAIYNRAPSSVCIPDNTATGNCRRWLGEAVTENNLKVECYLFNDGLSDWIGPTSAIYYRQPGQVCMPDGTATGACRKWFGNCQVTSQPSDPRLLSVSVAPNTVIANQPQTFTVSATDAVFGNQVNTGDVLLNSNAIGQFGQAITTTFPAHLIPRRCHMVPGECEDTIPRHCTRPHRECDPPEWLVDNFDLKARAAGYHDAIVPLNVNPPP